MGSKPFPPIKNTSEGVVVKLRAAMVAAFLLFGLRSQVPIPVTVENPTQYARTDWVRFTVPDSKLPAGPLQLGPFIAYRGREVGEGIRTIHARVALGALERITWDLVGVEATPGAVAPAALAKPTTAPPPIRVMANGGTWNPSITIGADGPAAEVHFTGRVPGTQLVAELWMLVYPDAEAVPFELLTVASDPRTTDLYAGVQDLRLEIDGVAGVYTWWPRWNSATKLETGSVRLVESTTFGDSQGLAWVGSVALVPTINAGASCQLPMAAVASREAWAGYWGPFGVVPDAVEDPVAYRDRLLRWIGRSESVGDPWRTPLLGLLPNSGATGGQDDFGSSKLGWAWAGGPTHALETLHSVLHEASRPGLWYEADGTLVQPWLHPDHVTWSGYTHWHRSYSGDRLGKGDQATPRFSGGYLGPDREHWSNNTLCGTYLLTGSRLLQRVIEKQARQILSGETLDPRLPGTSGVGAPRGIGRTLLSASWIDCCLEPGGELRAKVRERILARLEQKVEPFTRPPAGAVVSPLGTSTDARRMNGVECWSWEEPLGLVGLRAAELRFGSTHARTVLNRAMESWVRYGIWNDGATWRMADLVAYLGGQAVPPENYPTVTNPRPVDPPQIVRTEGFEEWSTGAITIAANILEGELQTKARAALAAWRENTVRDAEWRAVR